MLYDYKYLKDLNKTIEKKKVIQKLFFTTLFFLKRYFTDFFWWVPFLIAFFFLLGIAIIFPMQYAFAIIFEASIFTSTMLLYGILFYTLKNSTLKKNFQLTSASDFILYTSLFGAILSITFLVFSFELVLFLLFGFNGWLFQPNWFFDFTLESSTATFPLNVNDIWWGVVFYYFFMLILLSYLLAFIFQHLVVNAKSFYILALALLFYLIFFGDLLEFRCSILINEQGKIYLNKNVLFTGSVWFDCLRFLNPFFFLNLFVSPTFIVATASFQEVNNFSNGNPWAFSSDWIWNMVKVIQFFWIVFLLSFGLGIAYFKK